MTTARDIVLEDLQRSGMSDSAIEATGIKPVEPDDLERYASEFKNPAITEADCAAVIPYPQTDYRRLRLYPPVESMKYAAPTGSENHLYIPPTLSEESLQATDQLLLTEGEKKALKGCQEGIQTVAVSGVWNWKNSGREALCAGFDRLNLRRPWVLVYDSDIPPDHEAYPAFRRLAKVLDDHGATSVEIVTLPGGESEKVGMDDFLVEHSVDDLQAVIEDRKHEPMTDHQRAVWAVNYADKPSDLSRTFEVVIPKLDRLEREEIKELAKQELGLNKGTFDAQIKDQRVEHRDDAKQSERIAKTALDSLELFHSRNQKPFASIPVDDHTEHWSLESSQFRDWLGREFFEENGAPPDAQAIREAKAILRAEACFNGPTRRVWTRVAEADGNIYLDLGGPEWRAVKITPESWGIVNDPPVVFRRSGAMRPLPEPDSNGDISSLRSLLNADDDETWILTASFLVAALRPDYPYPILALHGEQGSGKSTQAKMMRLLVDPAKPSAKGYVKNERDLLIAARNNHFLNLDNLSGLRVWLADALCRLATGSGFSTRKLYTDDAEEVFEATRPIIMNGITSLTDRPDLADRAVVLNLPPVPPEERQPEEEVWSRFEEVRSSVLGGLLDAVSTALDRIDEVELDTLPRMADFARWVTAAAPALPWEEGQFIEAYRSNRKEAVDKTLEANPLAQAMIEFMEDHRTWEGKPSDLLRALERVADERSTKSDAWPGNASWLSRKLKRPAPFLRKKGIEIEWDPGGHSRSVKISKKNAAYGDLATQKDGKGAKDAKIPAEEGLW